MRLDNKVYNILKWVALILLPALSTLVMTLGDIWGLPYKEPIALTITAIDTFLGALLAISTRSYKGEGTLEVGPGEDTTLVLNDEDALEKAQKSGMILLSVKPVDDEQATEA